MKMKKIINRIFYLPRRAGIESAFVEHMVTRGQEEGGRKGLHASAILDTNYCHRQSVLSLLYQPRETTVPTNLQRIYQEGNFIHEMYQRLFLRAGYCDVEQCDMTHVEPNSNMLYTPDIEIFVPEIYEDDEIIVEIKSMSDKSYNSYKTCDTYRKGVKQLQLYMRCRNKQKGMMLLHNKNTQDFFVEMHYLDKEITNRYYTRLNDVMYSMDTFSLYGKLPDIPPKFGFMKSKCKNCHMRDACYDVGIGRRKI